MKESPMTDPNVAALDKARTDNQLHNDLVALSQPA